jgi:hypothetical protein
MVMVPQLPMSGYVHQTIVSLQAQDLLKTTSMPALRMMHMATLLSVQR